VSGTGGRPTQPDELITSLANPALKYARSLQRRRVRERERAVLVEGLRAILTALDHGVTLRRLFLDASRVNQLDPEVLERLRAAAGRTLVVANQPFQSLAETEHPQPVVAVCDLPELPLPRDASLVLALDGVRDPGNLGTLVRAAAAAGVDCVALLPGCVDPFNAKAVRASVGLVFALPLASFDSLADVVGAVFAAPARILRAEAAAATPYYDVDLTAPTLLVLGGEAEGLSDAARTYAGLSVSIPMRSDVESLNVAGAGTAILFEAARQRALAARNMRTYAGESL
jgi:TrmH family RNA methyltransferase